MMMRIIRKSTVAFGIGLAISAVAAPALTAGNAAASTSSAVTVTPPVSKTVILTNSSNGSSVLASIGELVIVELSGGPLRWSEAQVVPVASAAAPVLVRVSGSTSANGSSATTFRVANHGTAQIDATGTPMCAPQTACPQYVLLWHATVVVPAVEPPIAVAPATAARTVG
jgi:hypothetical protein